MYSNCVYMCKKYLDFVLDLEFRMIIWDVWEHIIFEL